MSDPHRGGLLVYGLATMVGLAVGVLLYLAGPAPAQDRGSWFKSLKQPGTGVSCCDISDCKAVEARWQAGGWWMQLPDASWLEVPQAKVLQQPMSIDGEAYACTLVYDGDTLVRCFIPPSPGS